MANIANPRKQFQFSVYAPGLNPFLCQKITLPEWSIDITEHGDTNYLVKTGGIKKIGKLLMEKISSALAPDNWVENWMSEVQNEFLGGGFLPSIYKRTLTVDQYSNDGITIINTWTFYGCWPSKRNGIDLDRKGSDNTMESIELEVDQNAKA
jgi:phage tail-like protein